jgi:hypothetical protein
MEPTEQEKATAAHKEALQSLGAAEKLVSLEKGLTAPLAAGPSPEQLDTLRDLAEEFHTAAGAATTEAEQHLQNTFPS